MVAKVIDFGFSTCIPHERKVKIFCGTPSYMAPEIVSKIEYSGPPADIWALGVLLYALLCGKFPFRGQNDKELYTNICKQEISFPDHVSPQARFFLNKLFHKNPDRRITAKEIFKDQWVEITQQEMEMLSPRHSHGYANSQDLSNFDAKSNSNLNVTQKVQTSVANAPVKGMHRLVLNPNEINYATQGTGSKDKRLTMFPDHIKQYVIDSNKDKAMKKDMDSKRN